MDLSSLLSNVEAALGPVEPRAGAPLRLGVGDSAKAAVIAALAREASRPVLVIVAKESHARDLFEELGVWLGADASNTLAEPDLSSVEGPTETPIAGLSGSRLYLYPQRDVLPYERVADDPWDIRARLEATAALHSSGAPIVIAAIEAVAQRTLSPAAARAAIQSVAAGDRLGPEDLLRRLQATGFTIVSLVEAPGQAARRGGIVDLFPPESASPARIEFLGSTVESIRTFDIATQRSRERLDSVRLGTAWEFSPDAERAAALLNEIDFRSADEEAAADLRNELETLASGERPAGPSFLNALLSPHSLLDHLPAGACVILDEPTEVARALDEYVAETATMRLEREARGLLPVGLPPAQANWLDLQPKLSETGLIELWRFLTEESGALRPPFNASPGFGGRIRILARDLAEATRRRHEAVILVSQQAARLLTLLGDEGISVKATADRPIPEPGVVQVIKSSLPHGWSLDQPAGVLTLLTDAEIFGFVKQRRALRQPGPDRSSLVADLTPGDYVVHVEHGIARFTGLVLRSVGGGGSSLAESRSAGGGAEVRGRSSSDQSGQAGTQKEFLELAYAQGDKLYVPVDQADRVARYVGPGEYRPELTRLGSGEWVRTRDRVRRAIADIAKELLELYASRQVLEGHAFSPDTPWQQELEASFPYIETPDQLEAIGAVKQDMETPRPMDRLISGDVGFGKTEIAVRAAFKAVMDGYQVAILVPTTVLAQQHFNTFRERLASLPARVEMLSRFLSDREQRVVVADLAGGTVDILIGTHRILQKDVGFKKLGLVIIDEEQRFGVAHKERLKQMRQEIDVLTLSATPIPRTLHMSLAGIRDLSNMTTAPEDRLPIRTYVLESDDQIVREAIVRELERGGQVFFVHNRVYNIELVAARIRALVPEATVGIGHGQMHEDQLERTMLNFARGDIDVLVCTTIIESGLDIPNANTIIMNQADRLGLAQLYQLRGRVGRGTVRAYAYLLYDRGRALTETAQRRLEAIFEATELGAGFQIAMRDLEIRGAGNLLGAEQSGHMAAVGFDLYVRLLAEAVDRLKSMQRGERPKEPITGQPGLILDLPITAHLPESYIPDLNLRLAVYQRLSQAASETEVSAIEQELRDRFGAMPPAARNLGWVVRLRLLATAAGIRSLQTEDGPAGAASAIVVRMPPDHEIEPATIRRSLPAGASVSPHQVRLDRSLLGDTWREAVVRVLAAISASSSTTMAVAK